MLSIIICYKVSTEKGEEFAKTVSALFTECSAKDDTNVTDLFRKIGKFVCSGYTGI